MIGIESAALQSTNIKFTHQNRSTCNVLKYNFKKFLDFIFCWDVRSTIFDFDWSIIPSFDAIINESVFDISVKLFTGNISFVMDLIDLTLGPKSFLSRSKEWSTSLTAFHISDNFIWAFIWFTNNILNLASREKMLILLLILVLFSSSSSSSRNIY